MKLSKTTKHYLKKGAPDKLKPCKDEDDGPDSDFDLEWKNVCWKSKNILYKLGNKKSLSRYWIYFHINYLTLTYTKNSNQLILFKSNQKLKI